MWVIFKNFVRGRVFGAFCEIIFPPNEPVYIQCLFYKNKTSHKVFRIIEMVLMEKIIQQDKLS